MEAHDKALTKAKVDLMTVESNAFILHILFSLETIWDDTVPTAAVDGRKLFLNKDWFVKLEARERCGLLAHEAWHVALDHITRCGDDRDPEIFNEAADYVINNMLVDSGMKIPAGGLVDPQYRDMSTEQVYKLIWEERQNPPPQGGGGGGNQGSGNCPWGNDIIPPKDEAQRDILEKEINQKLVQATQAASMAGQSPEPGALPGELELKIEELINPKLPWNVILQNYMNAFAKDDYSFTRFNRRFFPDFLLPGMYSEAIGEVAIAVDTSGSVSDRQFQRFLTEIQDIKDKLNPSLTTIIDFDTSIKHVHKLTEEQDISSVSFSGRGGTNLRPVFDYYDKDTPEVLIVFSDLWCSKIEEDPGYPVIWICIDNLDAEVNFGELIHFDTTEDE